MTQPFPDVPVVSGADDHATARELAGFRASNPGAPVVAVFAEQETADLYREVEEVTALAWAPVLARQVAMAVPPSPLGTVAPPPVVVGDGMLARHIVGAFVAGWSEPGQPLQVHCVGQESAWADEAREVTQARGELSWHQVAARPLPVVRRIRQVVDSWPSPRAGKASATGLAVVVALADPVATLAIACAVASAAPTARVAAVVDDGSIWPPAPGVKVFAVDQARASLAVRPSSPADRLAEQLFADLAWVAAPDAEVTAPEEPIFLTTARDDSSVLPWDRQPAELRAQVRAVANHAIEIFDAGSVVLEPAGILEEAVVSTPSELSAMAVEILAVLGVPQTKGTILTALELASRLPGIASRAGWTCRRPQGHVPLLSFDQVEGLSALVHLAYEDINAKINYASGSPVAHQLWTQLSEFIKASNRAALIGAAVAHAAAGLDWKPAQKAVPWEPTADEMELLAELEHRRWAIFQRRNGADDHDWMKPWHGEPAVRLPDDMKAYDVHIVREIPKILAGVGIEIVRL